VIFFFDVFFAHFVSPLLLLFPLPSHSHLQGESELRVKPFFLYFVLLFYSVHAHCRQVRSAFAFAAASGPIIILLDDIHALGNGSSVGDGGGSGNRAVGVLCGILDDLSAALSSRGSRVFVAATTSKPEYVHASLRRPGRLEKGDNFFVKFPFVFQPFCSQFFEQMLRLCLQLLLREQSCCLICSAASNTH
jgi:hypothetical protein